MAPCYLWLSSLTCTLSLGKNTGMMSEAGLIWEKIAFSMEMVLGMASSDTLRRSSHMRSTSPYKCITFKPIAHRSDQPSWAAGLLAIGLPTAEIGHPVLNQTPSHIKVRQRIDSSLPLTMCHPQQTLSHTFWVPAPGADFLHHAFLTKASFCLDLALALKGSVKRSAGYRRLWEVSC